MTYEDFFEIARYANENWKGGYTKKEYIQLAKEYYQDYEWSKATYAQDWEIDHNILCLIEYLAEDWANGMDEVTKWLRELLTEFRNIKYNNPYVMDFIQRKM